MSLNLSKLTRRAALALSGAAMAGLLSTAALAENAKVKLGIIGGEDEAVWAVAAEQAKAKGLDLELVVFNDYTQPNEALQNGEVDANAFQHQPYLDAQIAAHGYTITPVGLTAVWPIGLYSKKYHSVAELPVGAIVGIPNDPANAGRALNVLAAQGLIKLKDDAGILATAADITENPKKLEIKELDAGVVGRAIEDLDAAVVNTDWALKSGLVPETDRIAQEAVKDNPYNNFIAVKTDRKDEAWVKDLVASYQNDTVKAEFDKIYKGTGISAY
ncbi:MAG: MetQ/NlpA family ABC transporter substrate-binding protein [Cypionkella sp.]|uniref:MetQ/NlpA family ABC transporter substrate-binding protein n=1 Tax=Cypionkella sp. TaxID=2811411 RepID=UPI002ABA0D66|nr:MetQ/NlpA family ABC transporter substrate-binding protein [Cypionkella sp.]MDZ4310815.1 MetQ/NlpA family ABC transporter substrate-binding protein [Cypionkella sp.]